MATLELNLLSEHLEPDEIHDIHKVLADAGAGPLDEDEKAEPQLLDRDLDDDDFDAFVDRLDANEASADIYLPTDFEDVLTIGERRVGSAHALLLVLDGLREDFAVDKDEAEADQEQLEPDEDFEPLSDDEDEDFDDEYQQPIEIKDEQLRRIWHQLRRGANLAIQQGLCMFIRQ